MYYHLTGQLKQVYLATMEFEVLNNYYDHLGQRVISEQEGEPNRVYNYNVMGRMLSETTLTDLNQATSEAGVNPVLDYVYLGNHRVAVLTGTINPGPGPCFVATAAYGTGMSVDIQSLREFRNRVLLRIESGRKFVAWYNTHGPRYARWLIANPKWKAAARAGLWTPVHLTAVGFYGQPLIWIPFVFLCVLCVNILGKKLGWKMRWRIIFSFLVAFCAVMVYSMFVEVPSAYASRASNDTHLQSGRVYFLYEDHIGRPLRMTEYSDYDSDGSYAERRISGSDYVIWNATYKPFGQLYTDNGSVGITVGSGDNQITWEPPFRFPGQYADPELGGVMYYNQWRFYIPGLGRYNSADLLFGFGRNPFVYTINNPILFIDPFGLCECTKTFHSDKYWGCVGYAGTFILLPGAAPACIAAGIGTSALFTPLVGGIVGGACAISAVLTTHLACKAWATYCDEDTTLRIYPDTFVTGDPISNSPDTPSYLPPEPPLIPSPGGPIQSPQPPSAPPPPPYIPPMYIPGGGGSTYR